MRVLLFLGILICAASSLNAQDLFPSSYADYRRSESLSAHGRLKNNDLSNKKWFVSKYVGISTGVVFAGGNTATYISAPIGLQLNRKLNNNLYAFAGVSVAPSYVNFNQAFITGNMPKGFQTNSYMKSGSLGVYTRAELGLMYVNDEKTFSISGSIGIERSSYPVMPYNQFTAPRTRHNTSSNF